MISTRTELVIAGAVLIAGLGWWAAQSLFPVAPPSPFQLAAAAGCAEASRLPAQPGVRESVQCQVNHHDVTVVTFDDGRQRDDWVSHMHTETVVTFGAETVVAGGRWAVLTADAGAADRLAVQAHGWRV
ncbi:hypothetical protein [Dactylosporangium sp. CA-139066]|uniref:hypothetical protein n=1 Tax=Dactylosporangium sp. CA-139066 TaxID=3239930 RepID=UPI003D934004